ncbi:MAG TPA: hypothetical protein VIJ58_14445 [Candidatus Dormibacteraeota bacterium]
MAAQLADGHRDYWDQKKDRCEPAENSLMRVHDSDMQRETR